MSVINGLKIGIGYERKTMEKIEMSLRMDIV